MIRLFVVGISQKQPVFNHRSVYVGFVVDKVGLGTVLRVRRFSPARIITSLLHALRSSLALYNLSNWQA